jgi:hypothetical protein
MLNQYCSVKVCNCQCSGQNHENSSLSASDKSQFLVIRTVLDVKQPNPRQRNKSKIDLMSFTLPQYQNSNFTQVVEAVLREHAGQAMNSEKIAQILFNEVESDIFAAAKSRIDKVLWAGANQGRWRGISGKLGVYKMDLKKN